MYGDSFLGVTVIKYRKQGRKVPTMAEFQYITLRQKPELMDAAASWFHSKWGVPKEAYVECMEAYLGKQTELGWFLCLDGGEIVGGLGVIENDFHDRPDLTPSRHRNHPSSVCLPR